MEDNQICKRATKLEGEQNVKVTKMEDDFINATFRNLRSPTFV